MPRLPGRAFQWVLIAEIGPVAERLRMREIDDDDGRRLVRIVHGAPGRWWSGGGAQTVLLSAQGWMWP